MSTAPAELPDPGTTLAGYVRANERDSGFIAECEAAAEALVDSILPRQDAVGEAPARLRRQAVLVTGANLWGRRRRLTESGGYVDGTPVSSPDRPTRDPLDAARHILAPLTGPGIA